MNVNFQYNLSYSYIVTMLGVLKEKLLSIIYNSKEQSDFFKLLTCQKDHYQGVVRIKWAFEDIYFSTEFISNVSLTVRFKYRYM